MLLYWLWLANLPHISDREKLQLLMHFESPEACYLSGEAPEFLSAEGQEAFLNKDLAQTEKILAKCAKLKIRTLTWQDAKYPVRLKNIADPPLVLYYRGVLPDFDNEIGIGIVGTRQATAYGLSTAKAMGSEIAACGGLVISGMAAGIDAMATQGALDQGRPAVGVLGCGVDVIYPTSNRKLYQTMDQQGCLLSEFPPGEKPNRWNFPKRNRIISGLSCGVLVVEAPAKSGALITARQAIEQGRDVFVVPGNIGIAACEGSNALMKDGAAVATCGWDVLEVYDHIWPGKLKKTTAKAMVSDKISVDNAPKPPYIDPEISEDLDETEQRLLQCLSGRMLMDALIAEAALDPGEALAALTLLEVKGLVCTLPGGWVEKA